MSDDFNTLDRCETDLNGAAVMASPRPWEIAGNEVIDAEDMVVFEFDAASPLDRANAELIVFAVNLATGDFHASGNGEVEAPAFLVNAVDGEPDQNGAA